MEGHRPRRHWQRLSTALALLVVAFGIVAYSGPALSPAFADGDCDIPNGEWGCGGGDEDPGPDNPGPDNPGPDQPGPPQPHDIYYTPACPYNGPPPGDAGAMCVGATASCQYQGEEGDIMMRIYYQWEENGPWELVDTRCMGPDEEVEPVITPDQVRQWLVGGWLPAADVGVSPGNGQTLMAFPTIFYTDSASTYAATRDVPGGQVTVDGHATSYQWTWGDGSDDSTPTGGVAFSRGRPMSDYVTHEYAGPGTYTVDVDVNWTVTFQINGGPPQTLTTTVTRGATAPVQVLEKEDFLGQR